MSSKTNKKTRTVVILGAGASIEFLSNFQDSCLSTQRLTSIIADSIHDFEAYISEFLDKREVFWIKDFLFEITASLRKYFGTTFNFEQIIHVVDIIVDIYASKNSAVRYGKNSLIPNIYLSLIDYFRSGVDSCLGKIFFNLPEILRYYILDYICDHHYPRFKHEADKLDLNLWTNFLLKILEDNNISIFSLNYDSLLYEVVDYFNKNTEHYIDTGIKIEDLALENGVEHLNLTKLINAKNIFMPLHGSIHFVPDHQSVKFCRACSYAKEQRRRISVSRNKRQDGTFDYNQIMITGLSKFEAVAKEPFSTFYIRLIKDIIESSKIFIVGYGGLDQHLNMLLKSAYCYADEFHYITRLPEIYLNNHSLLEHLDYNEFWFCRNFLPESCFKTENQDIKITDQFLMKDKCYIYSKGTKYFLQNYNAKQ